MFENITKKRLAGAILAGVITITGATSAFADQSNNKQQVVNQNKPARMDFTKMSTAIKSAIDSLVTAKTITQEQADEVVKVFTPGDRKDAHKHPSNEARKNPLEELVTAGTITQASADAVNSAVRAGRESKKSASDVLSEMVTGKTITQTQADAVTKVFTPGNRKGAPAGASNVVRKNPLDKLVTAGTLTQAQADAVNAAVKTAMSSLNKQ